MLTTVLGAYQKLPDPALTTKILGSTTSLLTTLANPLNVSLLTSQLLAAPAIWTHPIHLPTCLRIISIYNTAAITVLKQVQSNDSHRLGYPRQGGGLGPDDWARAVVKGADDKSPRWRHVLVIAGVLLGMEGQERQGLSSGLRSTLEGALIMAANLAMEEPRNGFFFGGEAILLALNHTFDLLSEHSKRGIHFDVLAPIAINAMKGPSGYEMAKFVGAINKDVRPTPPNKFDWSQNSPSFVHLKEVSSRPLITSMGPFSRLVAYTVEHLRMSNPVLLHLVEDMQGFTEELANQWRQNKLSEVDPSEFEQLLTLETSRVTFPQLFQVLKSAMFALVVILRAVVGRVLVDPAIATDIHAPSLASSSLQILRNIYFITSRLGPSAFSAYTFVSLTSADILSRYPLQSKLFLESIRPQHPGIIPANALDRTLDLFFLNTAEHFPLVLSPSDNESLILNAANPYINSGAHKNLLEIFEAAHSATLAALAAPQNAQLAARIIPFYSQALFASFPKNLSPRQFRFAFKTLMQITTPPSPLAASHPLLPDTLLELLRYRADQAPTVPMPPSLTFKDTAADALSSTQPPLSEQAALTLALIDALPTLTPSQLYEWLPLVAEAVNGIQDTSMREPCRARLWEVLESGEMDVDRSAVCVAWWTSRGGREMVIGGLRLGQIMAGEEAMMSGALQEREGSRL